MTVLTSSLSIKRMEPQTFMRFQPELAPTADAAFKVSKIACSQFRYENLAEQFVTLADALNSLNRNKTSGGIKLPPNKLRIVAWRVFIAGQIRFAV